MPSSDTTLHIGWAQADITPDRPVILAGQFHARVSEGIMDPVTATALALESADGAGSSAQAVMVTCDLASISDELRDAVRHRINAAGVGLDPMNIVIGATHTHSAPDARLTPYGMEKDYKASVLAGKDLTGQAQYGMWPCLDMDIMTPAEYVPFAADRIADAVLQAWERRVPGGMAYGMSHAMVGRNRRLTYADGSSKMYGKPGTPAFRHVEGYENHAVQALMTYDKDEKLTGLVVNVPCPSQVSEHIFQISADYWHETRVELRKRLGEHIFILPQCAPAGDQSPHVLIGKRAEERMWRLKGRDPQQNAPRAEIALKIANAISDIVPYAGQEIEWTPAFLHTMELLALPRRLISEADADEALEEARPFKAEFERLSAELALQPELRRTPRWYMEITKAYRRMERGARVRKRLELQQANPLQTIEVHALRIGETAFASNPFELYLDYAIRIQELSPAVQTFLVQKAGCNGTYLPSARSIAHKGYGSVPASTDIGPEGGDQLVDWTVAAITRMWG
ncbi:MAG: hypothetical protein ABR497_11830 [Kiritimatiellia bacterium]